MTAESRADGGLGATPYRRGAVTPRSASSTITAPSAKPWQKFTAAVIIRAKKQPSRFHSSLVFHFSSPSINRCDPVRQSVGAPSSGQRCDP
jgi:hypothetical protein